MISNNEAIKHALIGQLGISNAAQMACGASQRQSVSGCLPDICGFLHQEGKLQTQRVERLADNIDPKRHPG